MLKTMTTPAPDSISTLPGELLNLPVTLEVAPEDLEQRNTTIYFTVSSSDTPSMSVIEESRFLGPRD